MGWNDPRAARPGRNRGWILGTGSAMLTSPIPGGTFTSTTLSGDAEAIAVPKRSMRSGARPQVSDKTPQVVRLLGVSSRNGWRGSSWGSEAAQSRQAGGVARRPGRFRGDWPRIDPGRCRFSPLHSEAPRTRVEFWFRIVSLLRI